MLSGNEALPAGMARRLAAGRGDGQVLKWKITSCRMPNRT